MVYSFSFFLVRISQHWWSEILDLAFEIQSKIDFLEKMTIKLQA